ncbi:MAG: cyclic pyranopterin monophosphate synthase MoaC [Verrucomicrobiaceae bacterium]|nr:cyclic pyranopterin monophosphate synthase MoaC [Verrucomicrobiaceae bacterium]
MGELSHVKPDGSISMVDVSAKPDEVRVATARGFVRMSRETLKLVRENGIKKGDVLSIAKIAGISAAKQTSSLIPLCHPLSLSHIQVDCELQEEGVEVFSAVRTTGKTGVEMEALAGVSVAALTLYDMCKAVDKAMVIEGIAVVSKEKTEKQ